MKKYILLNIFCVPFMVSAQSDSIPLFLGKTCQSETFCIDSVTCSILPFKLTCEAKSRSKKLPFLTYSYQIDWDSDGKIDFKGSTSSVSLNATNGLKLGKHKIIWRVTDVDSRSSVCEKDFEVKDCIKPVIYGKDYLFDSKLEPNNCKKTYSHLDLVDSIVDNCSTNDELRYKLLEGNGENVGIDSILKLKDSVTIEYQGGVVDVSVFAIDPSNNWTRKDVFVLQNITFFYEPCHNFLGILSGLVKTDVEQPIAKVDVHLNGILKTSTLGDGFYFFGVRKDRTYTLTLKRKTEATNGVTTGDFIAINRTILGLDTLQTPYRYLAADVNNDKKVSTSDLVELRKVILRKKDTFDLVDSWKFIPKMYKLLANPLLDTYPAMLTFYLDTSSYFDFIGIKMGDVNGTAKAYDLQDVPDRSIPSISYLLNDQALVANQPFNLRLPISELLQKDGFQFAIKIDPARATCLSVDGIDADSYSFDPLTGELLVAYVKGFSTGKEIIVQILPNANGRLQDILTFPTDKLVPEFYDNAEETRFAFGFDEAVATRFAAFPNPFSNSTTLKLFAKKAEMIEFKLHEANGRLVWSRSYPAVAGWNEVSIEASELPGSGTFYIQAKMEQGVLTEKLIYLH
jgi:hypothetical protein